MNSQVSTQEQLDELYNHTTGFSRIYGQHTVSVQRSDAYKMVAIANRNGLYDAADFISRRLENSDKQFIAVNWQ